ncbi:MAG: single-stranded-DNA-specific exonuclease RecJ [Bacteroidia bacterium]|nr:single-stranded-DNA-specific exonuclease RecJ [Bacteroidia bacterium]
MHKRWNLNQNYQQAQVDALQQQLKIHPSLCKLLVQRGITTFEEARQFFRPSLSQLHDPFLMKDMDVAVARVNKALTNQEKILVYGDYDVDGTTAVSLLYLFLKSLYAKVAFYIPDRYHEGYGVSFKGVEFAQQNGYTLIIALDCGIKAHDKVALANSYGIDFIICDHHRPGNDLPEALAILDPKRNDCPYPFKELSGCGVGFKLVQAIAQNNHIPFAQIEPYLDLVAVSIAADIVDIMGENRVLAHFGLKLLNTHPRFGINALINLSKVSRELSISDVVFFIAPRINAAGRIESGNRAVDLLTANDFETARIICDEINEHNTYRKELDTDITEQALQQIENDLTFSDRKSTVVYSAEWHKGVIGIVASRLTDKYYRPTVVMTQTNGHVAGSARSVKDFDVYNAIEACADLLDQFGGHMYAAGLTMKIENVDAFIQKFETIVSSTIEDRMLIREVDIDDALLLDDINDSFYRILKQFAPFGPGNMNPTFISTGLYNSGSSRIVANKHLKLGLMQKGCNHKKDGIAFNMADCFYLIENTQPFSIAYHIEENSFNNKVTLQLNIKDIKAD